jgi:hypothetical protein
LLGAAGALSPREAEPLGVTRGPSGSAGRRGGPFGSGGVREAPAHSRVKEVAMTLAAQKVTKPFNEVILARTKRNSYFREVVW